MSHMTDDLPPAPYFRQNKDNTFARQTPFNNIANASFYMEQKDIVSLIQTLVTFQSQLLLEKETFVGFAEKLSQERQNNRSRDLYKLHSLVKTWLKVLSLWEELESTFDQRKSRLDELIKEAEKRQYIQLDEFIQAFESYINNTSYLALFAFDIDSFEKLTQGSDYVSIIADEYLEKIKRLMTWVSDSKDFLEASKKSSREYKYYHLKYEMNLPGEEELEDINYIENEMNDIKEGEYKIPEDRQIMVIHRLVTDYSGKRLDQEKIIRKLKAYKPLLTTLPSDENKDLDDGPRMVDF